MYDLIIKNANILDGLGSEAYVADVAIRSGKIALIGRELSGAKSVIDASGLTLSPGWIDSHSHSDSTVVSFPDQKEKAEQGITFSIGGHCGSSAAPKVVDGKINKMSDFIASTKELSQGSSIAFLVGHNTVRTAVMGKENREPTKEELSLMCELVRDAMRAGAIGMSYGTFYVPACYAKTDELVALAKVVAEEGGLLAAHIRHEADGLIPAVEEYLGIIKESGCRAVFSHHKSAEPQNWGKVKTTLAMIDKANEEGADIYQDVYPYTASGTTMMARFCPKQFHPVGTTNAFSLLSNPEICEKIKAWGEEKWHGDLSWTLVTSFPGYEQYEGKNVNEIAELIGLANDPMEAALEIIRMSGGRARGAFFTMCEDDVRYVMAHPRSMICTDSSAAADAPMYHPRLRAAFPRALGRYARDIGVVSVPEMIRKMTSLPASVYGLKTKGVIAEGMDADICIFDADKIIDRADFVRCKEKNEGLAYVIIDGKVVVRDGVYNGTRAGKIYVKEQKLDPPFSIWSQFYNTVEPEEAILEFAKDGITHIELSSEHSEALLKREGEPYEIGRKFGEFCRANGISVSQAHMVFPSNIVTEPKIADTLVRQAEMLDGIGTKCGVLHVDPMLNVNIPYEEKIERNIIALKELAKKTAHTRVKLCLENLSAILRNIDEILYVIESVGSEKYGICLDTGHLNLTKPGSHREFILKAGSLLSALHVADNEGEYDQHIVPFGRGNVDFFEVIDALREVGYSGIFNYEIGGDSGKCPLPVKHIKYSFVKSTYDYIMGNLGNL